MKYSSKKKKLSISNTFQLSVLGFLVLSFFLGIVAIMSGSFDLRQQAAVDPYCTGQNQCITGSNICCVGLVQKQDTTCGKIPVRCVLPTATPTKLPKPTTILMVPSATPYPSGTCISNPTLATSCPEIGYYPATTCPGVCSRGLLCCGPRIQNQTCLPNQTICGPRAGGGYASYKCNSLGTGWTETICPTGYVCSESTRLCVLGR